MTFSYEIPEKQTLTMCLLSKVVWPTEEMIKHRQSLLDDALFLIRKQRESPCDKIDLPTIQRVNKRSPLLGDCDGDASAIMDRIHFAQPALTFHARDEFGHAWGTHARCTGQVAETPSSLIQEQGQDRGLRGREHLLLHSPREELGDSHDPQTQLFRQSSSGQQLSFD